jgi:hypothetical protein
MRTASIACLLSTAALGLVVGCARGSDDSESNANAIAHVEITSDAANAVALETGHPAVSAQPIYEPGNDAPAFFEAKLDNGGWAVVTASTPPHVVEYGLGGRSPTERLDLGARNAMKRVYRLDPAIYIAADPNGKAVGRTTKELLKIDRSGDVATFVPISNDDALATFKAARADLINKELTNSAKNVHVQDTGPLIGDTPPNKTCEIPGDLPHYNQLGAGEGPNTTACFSGCGPTAWAIVFGWASRRSIDNIAVDAPFSGLFPGGEAPMDFAASVPPLLMDLNQAVGTFCSKGEGATPTWTMGNVKTWVDAHAPGVTVDARYNVLMMPDNGVRDAVIDTICDGRPSIIGIGTLFGGDGHYPIAKGYNNGKFELNMGWGGDGDGFYDATTWFLGSIHH